MCRHPKDIFQVRIGQYAHPADAYPFCSSGKPQVLDCTGHAVNARLLDRSPSQDKWAKARGIVGDADIDIRFHDAFKLQRRVFLLPVLVAIQQCSRAPLLPEKGLLYLPPRFAVPDKYKVPGLREAY